MNNKCFNCGFNDHVEGAIFCQECGTLLVNKCSNKDCRAFILNPNSETLNDDAKYCPFCGRESCFFEYGYFDKEK